jgi:hypothetical protein
MSEEFSAGVNILLQRMETHPEEFFVQDKDRVNVSRDPKWHYIMNSVMQVKFKEGARGEAIYLTDAEVDALYAGYTKIRRKAFDDYVMDTVLNPEPKLSSDAQTKMQAQYAAPLRLSGASNNINSLRGIGGAYDTDTNQYRNTAQATAQHIAAHQEAIAQSSRNLMNAYPYESSQGSHPQQMPEGMLSKMAKGLGLK